MIYTHREFSHESTAERILKIGHISQSYYQTPTADFFETQCIIHHTHSFKRSSIPTHFDRLYVTRSLGYKYQIGLQQLSGLRKLGYKRNA